MTGLPPEVGQAFLNIVGDIVVREGGQFTPGKTTTELADGPAMPVITVADTSALTAVKAIYDDVHDSRSCGPIRVDDCRGSPVTRTRPAPNHYWDHSEFPPQHPHLPLSDSARGGAAKSP